MGQACQLVFVLLMLGSICTGQMEADYMQCQETCAPLDGNDQVHCIEQCMEAVMGKSSLALPDLDDDTEPSPPVDFEAKSLGSRAMQLEWSAPAGTDPLGYVITYNSTGQQGVVIDDSFVSSHTFHGLSPGTFYRFTIVAFYERGNSTPETIIERTGDLDLKTYPLPPTDVNLTLSLEVIDKQKNIRGLVTWKPPKDATTLEYYDLTIMPAKSNTICEGTIYHRNTNISKTQTSYLIPHDAESTFKHWVITYGCEYKIEPDFLLFLTALEKTA
ncbi:PREDICTED: titin-like [Priapulus caudatus]|uniref:Titin-like n=1 Tax=Priapulus caudatus TaxID=37621 RepID=A0ABM1DWL3_PRICU|nr:PREDICTED: titin-like [Priapulus caudatus]